MSFFFGKDKNVEAIFATVRCVEARLQVLDQIKAKLEKVEFREIQIQEQLARIMSQQEELDSKIAVANAKLDAIGESLDAVPAAIQAETQQIQDFIASHSEANLDLSGLDGVVGRLNSVADSVAGIGTQIGGVFEPPTGGGTPA